MAKKLDDAAMNRIIAKSGAEIASRNMLRRDLLRCETSYRVALLERQNNKSLRRNLDQVAKTARRLQQLLQDKRVWLEITVNGAEAEDHPGDCSGFLAWVIAAASKQAVPNPQVMETFSPGLMRHIEERSPLESLVGIELPAVYRRHCGKRAGYTGGIDFAAAVLHEFGIPCERKTIANAMDVARKSRRAV
jgi:hypothetical protein